MHSRFGSRALFLALMVLLPTIGHAELVSYLWNFNRIPVNFAGQSYFGPVNFAVYADTDDVHLNASSEWEVQGTAVIEIPGVGYAIYSDPLRVYVSPSRFGVAGIFDMAYSYWLNYDLQTARVRQGFQLSPITTYTIPLPTSVGPVGVGNIDDKFYFEAAFIPAPSPAILKEPASINVVEGASPTLSVTLQGAQPFSVHWRRDGIQLASGYSPSLTISNAVPSDSGEYDVLVTNLFGATISQKAIVTVTASSPVITTNPVSQGAMMGGRIVLEAAAIGSTPITWQWFLNDQPIDGATSNRFVRTKADPSMLGRYKAVASNSLGDTSTMEAIVDQSGIVAWGGSVGILPFANTNLIAITGGDMHFLALRSDGHVQTWPGTNGPNAYGYDAGQTIVPPGLDHVIGIGAGSTHSLALRDDGTITAWGKIYFTSTSNLVQQLNRNIVMVGTGVGAQHAVALKRDGTVVGWGAGTNYPYLQQVPASVTNIVSVAAGARHGIALRGDGGVVAWGDKADGQLSIPTAATNIVAIASTWLGNAALRSDGRLISWGGSTPTFSPTNFFVDIAGGSTWIAGLRTNGQIACLERGSSFVGVSVVPTNIINAAGVAAGSYTAFAFVGSGAPVFNTPAVDRRVNVGTNAFFRMWALGTQPISYHWNFNGEPIAAATNSWLVVSNVQPAQIGFYTITASNKFGMITSPPMGLNVPLITGVTASPSQLEFKAQTSPGLFYKLESKNDLLDPTWEAVQDITADAGFTTITVDSASPAVQRRFYRIRVQ